MIETKQQVPVLAVVLPLAFVIRVAVAVSFPNVIAYDEVFQFLEQAHRLVFGQGIVPWEFQVGLRSWLIPLLMAGPMELAHICVSSPLAGLIFIRVLLVLASLPIVWCATKWGEKFYGRRGAWIAGLLTAGWPDLWVMAPHPLEEVLGADLLLPAIFLVESAPARLSKVALTGFLLGVCFVLRLQLAPAIAIAGIALCRRDAALWRAGLLAGAVPVVLSGVLDWITWGEPFRSYYLNIYLNVFLGVAAKEFGASPPTFYLGNLLVDWVWTFPVILFLAWRGAKHLPVAGFTILAIIATHSMIEHKEFRFIFPAVALAVPLAGVGLAGMWDTLAARFATKAGRRFALVFAFAGPFCSPWLYFLLMDQTNSFVLFERINAEAPALVAIGQWGQSFLPLDVLLSNKTRLTNMRVFDQAAPRPDLIVATAGTITTPAGYHIESCHSGHWDPASHVKLPEFCVWVRDRPPAAGAAPASDAPPCAFPTPPASMPFILPQWRGGGWQEDWQDGD
jgi:hypothetical protein